MKKLEFFVSRLCLVGVIVATRYGYEKIWPQSAPINPQMKYSIEEQMKRISPPPVIVPISSLQLSKPIISETTVLPNYSYLIENADRPMNRVTLTPSSEIEDQ